MTCFLRPGFDADLTVFWEVFQRFVLMPVEGMDPDRDADLLLFQSALSLREPGPHDAGPHYMIDFTRQFSHEDEHGDYAGMEQLGCSFYYDVRSDFEALTKQASWSETYHPGDQFWGAPGERTADWIASVANSPSFQTAVRYPPRAAQIGQSYV